jgi:hypothetical protein
MIHKELRTKHLELYVGDEKSEQKTDPENTNMKKKRNS